MVGLHQSFKHGNAVHYFTLFQHRSSVEMYVHCKLKIKIPLYLMLPSLE